MTQPETADDFLAGSPPRVSTTARGDLGRADLLDAEYDLTYSEKQERYRMDYDTTCEKPSFAVLAALATITETDPLHFAPLQTVIDVEALNRFVGLSNSAERRISFEFEGYEITVESGGVIEVAE